MFAWRWIVSAVYGGSYGEVEPPCARGSKSRVASPITSPTTSRRPGTPSCSSCDAERSSGQKSSADEPVDLDAVALLGHREVEAAQPGLDVGDGDLFARGMRAGEGRVRVAVDEHPVGPLRLDHLADRRRHRSRVGGAQIEAVGRLGYAQLVEEDLRHRRVPVLSGVEHDLVDPGVPQCDRERRRLDELRAVPDDGEDFRHRRYDTRRFPGR